MTRELDHVFHDILETIARIEELTRGKSLEDFEASWQLQWMIQRAIEIISEASRSIPDAMANTRPEIPWRKVRGIGNILRHEYESISHRILWNVIVDELPRLKLAVEALAATRPE
jgi:uncharacterized protein with HEPN domain